MMLTDEVILHFAEVDTVQLNALSAGCAIPLLHHHCFALLLPEDLSRAATDQDVCVLLVVEGFLESDVGHEAVETSGNGRPFCMLLADPLLRKDLKVDLLVFPQLGDDDVVVNELDCLELASLVALWDPLHLAGIDCINTDVPVELSRYSSGFLSSRSSSEKCSYSFFLRQTTFS